jgi:rod shape-determining protein MreC
MRTFERGIISFLKKHQVSLVSLALALFSLHLALTDKREGVRGGLVVKNLLAASVSPLQRLVLGMHDAAAGVWDDYIFLIGIKKENDSLKNTIIALQAENDKLKEESRLNERLGEILKYKEDTRFKMVTAGIIGFNIDGWARTITINRGSAEGIGKEMAVLSPTGVVGRIFDVRSHTSIAILETDPRSDVDIVVERSRIKGVAEGNGTGAIILKYIRQADDVQVGDKILTSGLSVFPKGLNVGEVVRAEQGKDTLFKYVEVRPKVDFQSIEQVIIVTDTDFKPN